MDQMDLHAFPMETYEKLHLSDQPRLIYICCAVHMNKTVNNWTTAEVQALLNLFVENDIQQPAHKFP